VSFPSGVRGGALAAIAFSAYFKPQNAFGSKKNTILLPKVVVTSHIVTYRVAPMLVALLSPAKMDEPIYIVVQKTGPRFEIFK